MRNKCWSGTLLSILAAACMLLTPSSSSATPCVAGTMASYIALGSSGCTIDDKLFFDFGYTPTAGQPAAGSVNVTPDTTPLNPGLLFQASWQIAGAGTNGDALIDYTVQVLPGGFLIEDNSLGLLAGTTRNGGLITIVEGKCLGGVWSGATCTSGSADIKTLLVSDPGSHTDETTFAPVGLIDVKKDMGLSCGADPNCVAAFSQVSQNFSEVVPGPATLLLLGGGLLGSVAIGRKLSSKMRIRL